MFRSLFWYTRAAVSLFSSRKPLKKAEQFLLTDNRTEGDLFSTKYVKEWAKERVADSGSTINIKGLENIPDQNGILFMSNHQRVIIRVILIFSCFWLNSLFSTVL